VEFCDQCYMELDSFCPDCECWYCEDCDGHGCPNKDICMCPPDYGYDDLGIEEGYEDAARAERGDKRR
jgi:hypothetical protein